MYVCIFQNGFTPLHLASQEGHTDMVSLLLEHKANVNPKSHVCCPHKYIIIKYKIHTLTERWEDCYTVFLISP